MAMLLPMDDTAVGAHAEVLLRAGQEEAGAVAVEGQDEAGGGAKLHMLFGEVGGAWGGAAGGLQQVDVGGHEDRKNWKRGQHF